MRPFTLGGTTLIQGFLTLFLLVVLVDVASPTFRLAGFPDWTGIQLAVAAAMALATSAGLGVVMHTISRAIFHPVKQIWALTVLSSETVGRRLAALGSVETFPGGPAYADVLDEDDPKRVRKASAFMHIIEYHLMVRTPDVYRTIQVYRDQYRLARAFILPAAALALILPFWDPVRALDGAGSIGPFPIIRSQLFLLSALASAVSFQAFRERSYRYSAAKLLAFVTIQKERGKS
jgi:hypothetical protein